MRNPLFLFAAMTCVFFVQSSQASAQAPDKDAKASETKPADKCDAAATKEESSVTEHTAHIGGQTIPYKATAGTTILKNDKRRTDRTDVLRGVHPQRRERPEHPPGLVPLQRRPWLGIHVAAHGRLRAAPSAHLDGVFTAPAPYKLVDNTESLLDKTDMVFIDAMGTGYSHAVGKAKPKDFYGIDEDVEAFGQFIITYISRNDRWNSPKFLIGESYGTFRSAALGNYLQNHDTMHLNGIVPDLIGARSRRRHVRSPATTAFTSIYLPSYAAVAWYHKVLKNRPADLPAFVEEARKYAKGEYAAALYKGAEISARRKISRREESSRISRG